METYINSVDAMALESRWPAVFSQDGGFPALWGVRISAEDADAQALTAQRPPAIWLDAAARTAQQALLDEGYFVVAADDDALLLLHMSHYRKGTPPVGADQARLAAQGQGLYSLVQDALSLVEIMEEEIAMLQAQADSVLLALDTQRDQAETLRQEADALRGALDAEQETHMATRRERDQLAKALAGYRQVLRRKVMRLAARALPAQDRAIVGEDGEEA